MLIGRTRTRSKQVLELVRAAKLAKQRGAPLSQIAAVPTPSPPASDAGGGAHAAAAPRSLHDVAKAEAWLRRAAAAGHSDSQARRPAGAQRAPPPPPPLGLRAGVGRAGEGGERGGERVKMGVARGVARRVARGRRKQRADLDGRLSSARTALSE